MYVEVTARMSDQCRYCRSQLLPQVDTCLVCGACPAEKPWGAAGRPRWILFGRYLAVFDIFLWLALLLTVTVQDWASFSVSLVWFVLYGLILTVIGAAGYCARIAWVGICNLLIPAIALLFGLIMNCYGPDSSSDLLAISIFSIVVTYAVVATRTLVWAVYRAWYRPLMLHNPWHCDHCGYLLYGLPQPRCPECGEPFHPSELHRRRPTIGG